MDPSLEASMKDRVIRENRKIAHILRVHYLIYLILLASAVKKVARGKGLKFDNELTNKCKEKLKSMRLYSLASDVNVFWNLRLTSTAGLAYHDSARIDLNSSLKRFYPEEPERTLMHELAHLIANYRASGSRIQPHGVEWQKACSELGIPGENVVTIYL